MINKLYHALTGPSLSSIDHVQNCWLCKRRYAKHEKDTELLNCSLELNSRIYQALKSQGADPIPDFTGIIKKEVKKKLPNRTKAHNIVTAVNLIMVRHNFWPNNKELIDILIKWQ